MGYLNFRLCLLKIVLLSDIESVGDEADVLLLGDSIQEVIVSCHRGYSEEIEL